LLNGKLEAFGRFRIKTSHSGGVVKAVSHLLVEVSQRGISKFPIAESIFAKQLALTVRIIPASSQPIPFPESAKA
jgi:hypothetical protein